MPEQIAIKRSTPRLPPEERREQIVRLATSLFAEKGYQGTSLRDIAQVAGLTKAALYYYFNDKELLYEAVISTRMKALIATVRLAVGKELDPLSRIKAFMLASAGRIDEDPTGWLASSRTFWSIEHGEVRTRIVRLRDEFEGILRENIEAAVQSKQLKPLDPKVLTLLLLSALNYIPRWRRPHQSLSATDIANSYLEMILDGVKV